MQLTESWSFCKVLTSIKKLEYVLFTKGYRNWTNSFFLFIQMFVNMSQREINVLNVLPYRVIHTCNSFNGRWANAECKKVQTRAKSEQWTLSLRYVNGMWMQDEGFIGATRELSFYWVSSLARKHKKYVHVCIIISLKIILSDWTITDTERWEQGERIMNEQWGLCTWWARTKQNGERSVNARERTVSTK